MSSQAPASICILRLSALGDVSHVLPVINAIQSHWPNTKITWIIGAFEHRLVSHLENVEFITFNKKGGWREYLQLRDKLRGRRFDVLFLMQVALRANLASMFIKAKTRIGYDPTRAKDLHGLFVNRRIPSRPQQHVVDSFFEFLKVAGLDEAERRWNLPVTDKGKAFAATHLAKDRRALIISPCSSHALRNWHAAGYAEVADYAIERYNLQIILCGGPSELERSVGADIEAAMQHTCANLVGRDTVPEFVGLLAGAALIVTPDSGPAHIATSVDTAVIGLYAATNPKRSGPYKSIDLCVDKFDEACRRYLDKPAAQLKWGQKVEIAGVMDLISVEDVIAKLDQYMQRDVG